MKRLAYIILLALSVALFSTCEKFEVKPVTKVETGTATPISTTTISVTGKIIDFSGVGNGDHGFCYAAHSEPTIIDGKVSLGKPKVGSISTSIDGLDVNTQIFVRIFCVDESDVVYGKSISIKTLDGVASITTSNVTSIGVTSATCGGNITFDGGAPITARGVVWSTSQNPELSSSKTSINDLQNVFLKSEIDKQSANKNNDSKKIASTKEKYILNGGFTIDGNGTGSWVSELNELAPNTTYYVRAYATNNVGITYGNQQSFNTLDGVLELTTNAVTDITATTATCGGNIITDGGAPPVARGVVWSTSQNPTTTINNGITSDGAGTSSFVSNLTSLTPGVTYFVRAYATNIVGTSYGNQRTFRTNDGLPVLTTLAVTNITTTTASSGGNISSDGGFQITSRGVVWSTSLNPTINNNEGTTTFYPGTGSFPSYLTSLTPGAKYYVRAFATNSIGTSYGNQQTFTTLDGIILITTNDVTSVTITTAISGGNISYDGGASVIIRGIVWNKFNNPTIENNLGITNNGNGMGNFNSNMVGLNLSTEYFVRAYATNSTGTYYGNQQIFTTPDGMITVTTKAITTGSSFGSVLSGGNVEVDGNSQIISKGVCWGLSENPTVQNNHTNDGNGVGEFSSTLSNLSSNKDYFVRAFATSTMETVYGNQISFKITTPSVGPPEIIGLQSTRVVTKFPILNDGFAQIQAVGICWNTSPNPTINNNVQNSLLQYGQWYNTIEGLSPNTTYYMRSWARNGVGISYSGWDTIFTTNP